MKTFHLCLLLFFTIRLCAQKPGTLDKTFGKAGRVEDTTAYNAKYPAMLIQPDDKIVVGGQGFLKGSGIKTFRIDRFLKNGRPDFAFGDKGTVLVKFELSADEYNHKSTITCMALQPDGKIIAGGYYAKKNRDRSDFIVMRFLTDGSIDSSFGINGITKPKVQGYTGSGTAMLIQPDGKIVIGGIYQPYYGAIHQFFMERLLPAGNLDEGFGKKGQIIDTFGEVHALALQPDGKLIAAGETGNPFFNRDVVIRRYLPDGTPDIHFGKQGTVDTATGYHYNSVSSLALQPDGKMVIAGYTGVYPNSFHFMTGRYNGNGSIDKSYGNGGIAIALFTSNGSDVSVNAEKVMLWKDKIIAVGDQTAYYASFANGSDVYMVAYNKNGTIDSGFAVNGKQTINYDEKEQLGSAALQSDGSIVVLDLSQTFASTYQVRNLLRYYGYSSQMLMAPSEKNQPYLSTIASSLRAYPNPAVNYIVVNGLQGGSTVISIHDGSGKLMSVHNADQASHYRCDVSKLTAGIYYLEVKTDGEANVLKFMKE